MGVRGDNDPLDVVEIGSSPLPPGSIIPVPNLYHPTYTHLLIVGLTSGHYPSYRRWGAGLEGDQRIQFQYQIIFILTQVLAIRISEQTPSNLDMIKSGTKEWFRW